MINKNLKTIDFLKKGCIIFIGQRKSKSIIKYGNDNWKCIIKILKERGNSPVLILLLD